MEQSQHEAHESLVKQLNDTTTLSSYKDACAEFHPGFIPRLLGAILVGMGNIVYGKKPSYEKFKAVEVIARIPYQSWEAVTYVLLTLFYSNEKKAVALAQTSYFSRMAQDNETMHVVVISQLLKGHHRHHFFLHTVIPFLFSFFYFIVSYLLYMVSRRASYELNYLFEDHAFEQYSTFLETHEQELKEKEITSDYLTFYGREVATEYDFFLSVRNDELIHRNQSYQHACE